MDNKQLSKAFWLEASRGGLILGLILFIWSTVSYYFDMGFDYGSVVSVVQFLLLLGGVFYFAKRMATIRGNVYGFTYGQSMGFILALMLFTGIIYGVGEYILQVIVDPQYFSDLFEMTLYKSNLDERLIEETLKSRKMMTGIMQNPFVMIFSGIFTMVIYGGLIGLIVSAFIKKPADPFADHTTLNEEE